MLFVHLFETLRMVNATAMVMKKHIPNMMWNSSRSNLSRVGPGGIENLIMKGMLTIIAKTKTTIKNSNMLPMD
jgi:hypothetical protein